MPPLKIITYNVNGLRAAMSKGWLGWVKSVNADVLCLQEIKVQPGQLDLSVFEKLGYHACWFPAEKKGYSGVAILSRQKPDHVEYGCGMERYDREGRMIRADYGSFSVMSVYMPSGTTGEVRQSFKMKWLEDFQQYVNTLKIKRKNLVIGGDYNICHRAIDIHNPVTNARSSGFLPEEREWIGNFIDSGYIDSFRHFNQDPRHYTWWTYRAGARERNLGWRIDYLMTSKNLEKKLIRSEILNEAMHSDHCPVSLEIEL